MSKKTFVTLVSAVLSFLGGIALLIAQEQGWIGVSATLETVGVSAIVAGIAAFGAAFVEPPKGNPLK